MGTSEGTHVVKVVKHHRIWMALLGALVAPLTLAAVLVPFRDSFTNAAAALLLVAVVAVVAVAGNRFSGVVASLSSALWFDFFLTRPYERLVISHRNDIETTVSILIVGVIVTELAARSRHHFKAANEGSNYVEMIHGLAAARRRHRADRGGRRARRGHPARAARAARLPFRARDWSSRRSRASAPTARCCTSACSGRWTNIGIPVPRPRSSRSGAAG
jgi:hypothetical protein